MSMVDLPPLLKDCLSQRNIKNMSIADVGCGKGVFLSRLLPYLTKGDSIVGIDLSQEKLSRLREQFGLKTIATDAVQIGIRKECFDIVISNQVMEHVPDDLEMLRELYRVLKRDGHLYLMRERMQTFQIFHIFLWI